MLIEQFNIKIKRGLPLWKIVEVQVKRKNWDYLKTFTNEVDAIDFIRKYAKAKGVSYTIQRPLI